MKETNEWYQIELDTTKYTPVCAFTFHVPGGMSRSHSTETYVEYVRQIWRRHKDDPHR